jgi:hypothetical protein
MTRNKLKPNTMSEEKPTYAMPENNPEIIEHKIIPFGHQLMGLDPDNLDDTTVTKVKLLAAEMAEIMKKDYENERGPLKSLLFDHALGEILNASMSVVKVITLKNK